MTFEPAPEPPRPTEIVPEPLEPAPNEDEKYGKNLVH